MEHRSKSVKLEVSRSFLRCHHEYFVLNNSANFSEIKPLNQKRGENYLTQRPSVHCPRIMKICIQRIEFLGGINSVENMRLLGTSYIWKVAAEQKEISPDAHAERQEERRYKS